MYRLQLEEFRKLDLHLNTESDLVELLVPPKMPSSRRRIPSLAN